MSGAKTWFLETRPQFLLLTIVTALVGLGYLIVDRVSINWTDYLVSLAGALLAHVAVNVLNDYFDYVSGIDLKTTRTPFSGGSGILPAGLLKPKHVYFFGLGCLALDFVIATYFYFKVGVGILVLALLGAALIYGYTPWLTKIGLAEASAGAGFGLMALGFYYVQTGSISPSVACSSLLVAIVVSNLLLLNEIPDTEADREAGRRHIPAVLGKRAAAVVYSFLWITGYALIIVFVWLGYLPLTSLVLYISLPLAIQCIGGVTKFHSDTEKLISYMAKNVLLVHLFLFLLFLGAALYTYLT